MRDFTLRIYRELLESLQSAGFQFQTFEAFIKSPATRAILLRHDVDDRKLHSLEFARIQHNMGIKGTFYFRMVPQSFDEGVIKEIYDLGHEVGYHYEDMDFANGDPDQAIQFFEKHLKKLRTIVPVETICMHGSPRSKYDNKDVWKKYNYQDYDIIGEPYFDLDFNTVYYLTDTGRRWDGYKVSVRDKVQSSFELSFHSTAEIITAIRENKLPERTMINFHPQRWTDEYPLWVKEKYIQQIKNIIKYYLIKFR
ncbi:MAG: hypothetical protein DHS20C18_09280 [Saprospiraceae bacterium]|nr:MAG: hypothetical protein DHS20C18_09280 [Saprospiraceae bacterium]